TMIFALGGMIYLSPILAMVAMFPPLMMAIGTNRFAKTLHERFTLVQEQYSNISTKVQENLTGIRVVKAYTREDSEVEAIRDLNKDYLEKNLKYFRSMGVLYPFFDFSHNLGIFVVLSLGSYLMIQPGTAFQVGDFAAFILYLNMLHFPMISIGWVLNVIQRGVASLTRINEIFDTEPVIADPPEPLATKELKGRLTFKNVDFGYNEDGLVLKNIDLDIRPGMILGVVGATGSGKSTLTHLIPRFYDPTHGEVLLDGEPLSKYRLKDLRKTVGLVAQDHFMFSTTVGKNIGFGMDPTDYSMEAVEQASRLAVLHENVVDFPRGYETMVGERGVSLSGGQRQRAAIARALAINPRILILDDALSAVDTHTEEQILSGLRTVMKERTTLLISHRISTVHEADWIVVLEKGEIIEQGTHEDLVALGGVYATMHRHQLLEEQIEEMSA
ncbi:MAG: ABC transporter ATP-binding protein, partial [Candidatus Omnitrophica bacterium]|nr:ABC transporter ATP-binding protein [Candidatus Omnitrophota bacterium]